MIDCAIDKQRNDSKSYFFNGIASVFCWPWFLTWPAGLIPETPVFQKWPDLTMTGARSLSEVRSGHPISCWSNIFSKNLIVQKIKNALHNTLPNNFKLSSSMKSYSKSVMVSIWRLAKLFWTTVPRKREGGIWIRTFWVIALFPNAKHRIVLCNNIQI